MGPVGEGIPLRNSSFTGGGKDPTIGSILSLSAIVGHQIRRWGREEGTPVPRAGRQGGYH